MGRLTRAPEVRYTQGAEPLCVARYSLAVNKRFKKKGEPEADFIPCVAFGKNGEFAEKYFDKGQQIAITGRIQVRNWEDSEGRKRTTTEVVVEEQYFAESKAASQSANTSGSKKNEEKRYNQAVKEKNSAPDGFYQIEEDIEDNDLPF